MCKLIVRSCCEIVAFLLEQFTNRFVFWHLGYFSPFLCLVNMSLWEMTFPGCEQIHRDRDRECVICMLISPCISLQSSSLFIVRSLDPRILFDICTKFLQFNC